mmetsp:Transcript_41644/g.67300  ORF Transcript_41644/g.67300 Transcript_41644/m.67300 type:complete len:102 (-) Transcript_41644:474-779(-)
MADQAITMRSMRRRLMASTRLCLIREVEEDPRDLECECSSHEQSAPKTSQPPGPALAARGFCEVAPLALQAQPPEIKESRFAGCLLAGLLGFLLQAARWLP